LADSPHTATGTLLALDFGLRRIGLATASTLTGTATPLQTISAHDGEPDWDALDAIVTDWRPAALVAGMPFNTDGSESAMTARTRAFAAQLEARYGLEVSLADERYTSVEAEAILKQQRQSGARNKRIRKADVDSLAAALIAESWLRGNSGGDV